MGPCHSLRRVHHSRGLGPRVGCPVACTVPLWLLSLSPCIAVKPDIEYFKKKKTFPQATVFRSKDISGHKTKKANQRREKLTRSLCL